MRAGGRLNNHEAHIKCGRGDGSSGQEGAFGETLGERGWQSASQGTSDQIRRVPIPLHGSRDSTPAPTWALTRPPAGAATPGRVRCGAAAAGRLGGGCLSFHQVACLFSFPHLPPGQHSKRHPKIHLSATLTQAGVGAPSSWGPQSLDWAQGHVWTESPRAPTPGPGLHVPGHRCTGLTSEPGPDTP